MVDFKYRLDIDGLRAVAVTLVLLFHADLGFSGGFIGVDIFFVVSGFLITSLILREQDAGSFSLVNFWIRRVRRIIPAATVMAAIVLAAGFFLLLPSDYADLASSTIAQQFMASNVYFWKKTGYFDGPAELKPLLHTWSLAVEEQFYLGYPFLLMFVHRLGRHISAVVLSVLAIGSLTLSQYGVLNAPSATFFLLPTRAWELLLGGLICFVPSSIKIKPIVVEFLSWISLAAILASGWIYSVATPFPGFSALVPCLGTATLIHVNSHHRSVVRALLSAQPIVFVGLISYSLYLWHWPLLAYARYWLDDDLDPTVALSILAVSVLISMASWRYIETPIRSGFKGIGARPLALGAISSALLIVATSYWVHGRDGLPERFPRHIMSAAQKADLPRVTVSASDLQGGYLPVIGAPSQTTEPPDFIVWGDSHAMALTRCFDALANRHGLTGVLAPRVGTIPILGVWRPHSRHTEADASEWNQAVIDYIRREKIQNVFLVARWAVNIEGQRNGAFDSLIADEDANTADVDSAKAAFDEGLSRTLDELEAMGCTVWILKQVPLQKHDPHLAFVRCLVFDVELPKGVSVDEHRERQKNANALIDENIKGRSNVVALDLSKAFFRPDGSSQIGDSHGSFYRDDDHVSDYGAQLLIAPVFEPVFARLAQQPQAQNFAYRRSQDVRSAQTQRTFEAVLGK